MKKNKGFTLIELLVVVTIIGILAAIVMTALTDARKKGGDAGVKSNLVSARSQAEVFWNTSTLTPASYVNVCYNGVPVGDSINAIGAYILAAAKATNLSSYSIDAIGNASTAVCNDSPGAWAAQAPLKQGGFWCVDWTNKSLSSSTSLLTAVNDYSCS